MTDVKSAALKFAKLGMKVIPIRANDKAPLTPNGYKNGSSDKGQIRQWIEQYPGANIGVVTGKGSGVWVLDVDVKKGQPGLQTLEVLEKLCSPFNTLSCDTWSGGKHYYFSYPKAGIKTGIGVFPGVDIKSDGGYVVAPPSQIEGKPYQWIDEETEIAEAPELLYALLKYGKKRG